MSSPETNLLAELVRQAITEVQGCRRDISDMRVEQESRLTALEQHDVECYGNGQPGWRKELEDRVDWLHTKALIVIGGSLVVGFIFHFAWDLLRTK